MENDPPLDDFEVLENNELVVVEDEGRFSYISRRAFHLYNLATTLNEEARNYPRRIFVAATTAGAVATTLSTVSTVASIVSMVANVSAFPIAAIAAGYIVFHHSEET